MADFGRPGAAGGQHFWSFWGFKKGSKIGEDFDGLGFYVFKDENNIESVENNIEIGDMVEVPFGSKSELGIIWKNTHPVPKNIRIKNISKKIDYSIDKKLIEFVEWFSTYNR